MSGTPAGPPEALYRCDLCGTDFEPDVADPGPGGAPRCPQCGLWEAHAIAPEEAGSFVVRKSTKFR